MRNYGTEFTARVEFLRAALSESGCKGFVFGNSGGKDSALVGILCKAACEDTVGVILPCESRRNYTQDADDARALAGSFGIESRTVDLTPVRKALIGELENVTELSSMALVNLAPRLRMTTLYAIAAAENRLVVGTGNRSEIYIGYYTKWGDGASDLNPIADLCATEVLEFLRYLKAPESILSKAPSAGLFDGQTDEQEIGVSYAELDHYLQTGEGSEHTVAVAERMHRSSAHKRSGVKMYG